MHSWDCFLIMADSVKAPFREAVSIDLFFHKIVEIERFALQVVILDARGPLLSTFETKMAAHTGKRSILTILQ